MSKSLEREQRKNKNELLADHRLEVKRLQSQKTHLQNSCDGWKQRFELICRVYYAYAYTHAFILALCHTHQSFVHTQARKRQGVLSEPWSLQDAVSIKKEVTD